MLVDFSPSTFYGPHRVTNSQQHQGPLSVHHSSRIRLNPYPGTIFKTSKTSLLPFSTVYNNDTKPYGTKGPIFTSPILVSTTCLS
ncbi:hypothetical protein PM082_015162 [Marasmius tenuissimus]|nr:hypothetical protein PM082_015162 [Marasmius tenuissimus]